MFNLRVEQLRRPERRSTVSVDHALLGGRMVSGNDLLTI
jgi:hypothetical protein